MPRSILLMVPLLVAGAAIGVAAQAPAPPAPDPAVVEQGMAVYAQQCSSCHGANGEGGVNWREPNPAGELQPPPHDDTGHTWRHSDGALFRMVMEGWRDPFNRTERLTMPAFEGVLAGAEVQAVIAFLKTLWTPEQRLSQFDLSRTDPFPLITN